MAHIEEVIEGDNIVLPDYSGTVFTEDAIARNSHRNFVGGGDWRWARGARAQLDFLKKRGLRPHHKFLDVGCGSLRAATLLLDYLEPGNYYGVDANRTLMQAGYDVELTDAQRAMLPVENLRANDRFNVDFGVSFDFAIAQSVFTHVSLNHMRLCLFRLAKVMSPGGTFYASFFEQPTSDPIDHIFQRVEGGRTYFYEKNIFWYHRSDMRWAADSTEWGFRYVGEYGSPDSQLMVAYNRLTEEEAAHVQARRDLKKRIKRYETKTKRAVRQLRSR